MSEQQKSGESSRNLLEQMEGGWDAPEPGSAKEKDLHAELDAAADRLVQTLDPPPVSGSRVDDLDGGWDDDEDEEEEDDEADEPELPDERLDPVAYAAAKKAREERIEAKRQRRRLKAEAKKARRKARVDAQKQKQKGKTKKARAPQKAERPASERKEPRRGSSAVAKPASASADTDDTDTDTDFATADEDAPRTRKPSPNRVASKSLLSGTNQWMLAVAVVVFVAAAIFAAVVAR